jgi:DNA-binding transcriptional LysR family regulator
MLKQDSTLIAVIEMSLSSWLVAGIVPSVERQPLKKLAVDESALLSGSIAGVRRRLRSVACLADDPPPRLVFHLLARQLASAQLDDVPVMVIDSLSAQKRLIEAGIGIALLPKNAIQEELRLGTLHTIDVPRLQTTVPVHVLHRKNGYLTGASRTLKICFEQVWVRLMDHPALSRAFHAKRRSSFSLLCTLNMVACKACSCFASDQARAYRTLSHR